MRFALLLLPVCLAAQPSVEELLARSDAARQENAPKEHLYTYHEEKVDTELDKNDRVKKRSSETWEGIGLEGAEYRKLIARDGKPLSAKEQKKEDERLRKEAELRRRPAADQQRWRLFSNTWTLSFKPENAHLFAFRLVGEDTLDGRAMYVLDATPKPDAQPRDDNERELLRFRFRSWIDRETSFEARFRMEGMDKGKGLQPGSVIDYSMRHLDDGTWVMHEFRIAYIVSGSRGEQVTTRSNYKRFSVDSRLVEEDER